MAVVEQTTPTKPGWHLVSFRNGDYAVVRWDQGRWSWGGLKPPSSPITGITWLGSTVQGILDLFPHLSAGFPGIVDNTIAASLDHGNLMRGQPLLIFGKLPGSKQQPGQGSEAVPVNVIPSPIDPSAGTGGHISVPSLSSIFGFLGQLSFWKGIGLVIAGGGILVFAALELRKI